MSRKKIKPFTLIRFIVRNVSLTITVFFALSIGKYATAVPNQEGNFPVCGNIQIIYPLYSYPDWYDPPNYIWDDVAIANQSIPVTAIINPSNGPGTVPPNADYQQGLNDLRATGTTILGYSDTDYGNRNIAEVKSDIDKYDQFFNIDGIFFDQSDNTTNGLQYYTDLYSYVKAKQNLDIVVTNPGTNIAEVYLSQPATDTALIYENTLDFWNTYQPSDYLGQYSMDRFAAIVYGVSNITEMKSTANELISHHVGNIFITNKNLPNPYDQLPSYWNEEVAYLASIQRCKQSFLPFVSR